MNLNSFSSLLNKQPSQYIQINQNYDYLELKQAEYEKQIENEEVLEHLQKNLEFNELCAQQKDEFNQLLQNKDYKEIFAYPGIKKLKKGKIYPFPKIADQDDDFVISANKPLYTSGLGGCICVMARGKSKDKTIFLAMRHVSTFSGDAKTILEGIKKGLELKDCQSDSIEFFLVGGQLPYKEEEDFVEYCDGSLDFQKEFLTLATEFNIKGAQFNIVEDDNALSVLLTENEIVWIDIDEAYDFAFEKINSNSNSKSKRKYETKQAINDDDCVKKQRFDQQLNEKI